MHIQAPPASAHSFRGCIITFDLLHYDMRHVFNSPVNASTRDISRHVLLDPWIFDHGYILLFCYTIATGS